MLLHDTVPVHVKGPPTTVGAHEILTSVAFSTIYLLNLPQALSGLNVHFQLPPQSRSELYSHLNV